MTQKELIEEISVRMDRSIEKKAIMEVLRSYGDILTRQMEKVWNLRLEMSDDNVMPLVGVGNIHIRAKREKVGFNPHVKERMIIPQQIGLRIKIKDKIKETMRNEA